MYRKLSLFSCVLVLFIIGNLVACDSGARDAADSVRDNVNAIQQAEEVAQGIQQNQVDTLCQGITDTEIAEVEAKMEQMSQDMVILTGRDNEILACSRAKKGML